MLLLFAQLHLFDGLAMLTKLRVSNGRVWGSQKYVESEQYRWALSARDTLQKEVICKYFWTCFCAWGQTVVTNSTICNLTLS